MDDVYRPLVEALEQRSLRCYFQSPDQLVISRQPGPALPFAGNSFCISRQADAWYVWSWAPHCYRVPPSTNLVALCMEFVDRGHAAQAAVPADLVARYGLVVLPEKETAALFGQ
jgi:hypothetical protein